MMISYVAIDYQNKYKIDLINCIVTKFDEITKQWTNIISSNISKSINSLKKTNILTFVDDGLAYTVEVSTESEFINCNAYNKELMQESTISINNYVYDMDTLIDLFINDSNDIPQLNKYTFYAITNAQLDQLESDKARIAYLINLINNSIKGNADSELVVKEYVSTLANLVFKNNPEIEKNF